MPAREFGILSIVDKDGTTWAAVPEQQGASLLAVDLANDPFKLPVPAGMKPGTVISGMFSVCASEDGTVVRVKGMRGMGTGNEAVDASWMETMKRWRYRPYLIHGVPTRFCTNTRPRVVAPHE